MRLMFQDEARFGRMVRIRRCWAPVPERPVVDNGYERQFVYVYGGVSPMEGELDWMICPKMNTERMGQYLAQVTAAHPDEFIVMVVDGASSHVAKDLVVPENIRLLRLPSYSPELNPQEHLWDELREKEFPNRVFSDLASVTRQLDSVKTQANIGKKHPLQQGCVPFPKNNKFRCPNCGAEADLTDPRRQIEAQAKKPVVT